MLKAPFLQLLYTLDTSTPYLLRGTRISYRSPISVLFPRTKDVSYQRVIPSREKNTLAR